MVQSKMRQRGSVKIFVIVGIVLTVLAMGVLYGVKRLAMSDQTPPMNTPVSTGVESSNQTANSNDNSSSSAETQPADNSTPQNTNQDNQTSQTTAGSTEATANTASNLPQTGPVEDIAGVMAIIAAASVALVKSRRLL